MEPDAKLQFIPEPEPKQEIVVLLATPGMRDGPASPLVRLVREFEPYWRSAYPPPIICAVEGAYRAILRSGSLRGYPKFYCLPPGFRGALVYASDFVITYAMDDPDDVDKIDNHPVRVFYLIDPADPTSVYSETIALKRDCVVAGKTFLATRSAAAEWLTLQWYRQALRQSKENLAPWCLTCTEIQALADRLGPDGKHKLGIALVAHDRKKTHLLDFAFRHFDYLNNHYSVRYATGTTGTLLNGQKPPRPLSGKASELERIDELRRDLAGRLHGKSPWVSPQPSGPRGGDVQIARRVLDRQCRKVLFFEDPHYAREHEPDIQLLERTSRIPDLEVLCIHDYRSAEEWARAWEDCIESGIAAPMTLTEAYRRLFDVELIATSPSENSNEEELRWRGIVHTTAYYLLSFICYRARARRPSADIVRIGVTWGSAMHEVIDEITLVSQELEKIDGRIQGQLRRTYEPLKTTMEEMGDWPPMLTENLACPDFVQPTNVRAVPLVGIMGAVNPEVEANQNAKHLVDRIGGEAWELPQYAFLEREFASAVPETFSEEWEKLDVLVYTCEKPKPRLGSKVFADIPKLLWSSVNGSEGELGGMYLDEHGEEWPCGNFVRQGIPHSVVCGIARKGGAVLITGAQQRRLKPALAALRGGLASTFITDIGFAWELLRVHVGMQPSEES